eukprot:4788716-Prymnesium_polylepis.1
MQCIASTVWGPFSKVSPPPPMRRGAAHGSPRARPPRSAHRSVWRRGATRRAPRAASRRRCRTCGSQTSACSTPHSRRPAGTASACAAARWGRYSPARRSA